MLAVVKTPRIDVRIRGNVPAKLLRCLKSEFGSKLKVQEEKEDDYIDFFETQSYTDIKKTLSPGTYVRIYRENKELTQQQLGELLNVSKAYICDIEKDRRSISKVMAKTLSKTFQVPIIRFI
jgi:DNA-binding XRE family transcriptional regulator